VSSDVADAMTVMLQSAVSNGTGGGAALPDRPVAGKTGTAEGARDLWFIGSIPQLTTAIWFGYDQNWKTGSSSATVNPFQTVERKDVGLMLKVRPQISENGTVKMAIYQEVSKINENTLSAVNGPTTSKRSIESNVLVEDGAIVVLGGLIADEYSQSQERVPLLGDIPGLGALFRSKARSRSKTNLMVFIRPTILRTPEDSRRVTEQRYGYLRQLQGYAQPGVEPSIDELVRDYMNAAPPIPHAPMPGNIEDPRIAVPVAKSVQPIKRRD
jgi:general secretion pathway protein D